MEKYILFYLPDNKLFAETLATKLKVAIGSAEIRNFPDNESYIRIDSDVKNRNVILVCTFDHPNNKILPLLFFAKTLKELGANKIYLISPYLAYMRQDKRFHPGEAVTSTLFAKILSGFVDFLITIDPHLHRIHDLSEIFTIPSVTLHATKEIASFIRDNIKSAFIIGPDEESRQWVTNVAENANVDFVILKKTRHDDRNVSVLVPDINDVNKTPVLVDDIISTGASMLATIQQLLAKGFKNPVCIGVHALFNKETFKTLLQAGARTIITCNTIQHFSNKIDITDVIVEEILRLESQQSSM